MRTKRNGSSTFDMSFRHYRQLNSVAINQCQFKAINQCQFKEIRFPYQTGIRFTGKTQFCRSTH